MTVTEGTQQIKCQSLTVLLGNPSPTPAPLSRLALFSHPQEGGNLPSTASALRGLGAETTVDVGYQGNCVAGGRMSNTDALQHVP